MTAVQPPLIAKLSDFANTNQFRTTGSLSVALVVTQHARSMGLPLDPEALLSERGGQVLGLGKGAVQAVLAKHGIDRVLSKEAGRTSRGSIDNMRAYVVLLNTLHATGEADLDEIEKFWIEGVTRFFAGKPFRASIDAGRNVRSILRHILEQAEERQKSTPGVYLVGAVMQYMVGAKLDVILGPGKIEHNSYSTSDDQTKRAGDFLVGDVAIHVTTSPADGLIDKMKANLSEALRPVVVTTARGVTTAEVLAEGAGISERLDCLDIEQFMTANLYELGGFEHKGRQDAVEKIVTRYNEIIDEVETNPSLKIEFVKR